MMSTSLSLLICEKSGDWAARLRRAAAREPFSGKLRETRTLAECEDALREQPASLVVLEMGPSHSQQVLDRLVCWNRRFPLARCLVVSTHEMSDWAALLSEAGAVASLFNKRDVRFILSVARRMAPVADVGAGRLRQQVWNRLPWDSAGEEALEGR